MDRFADWTWIVLGCSPLAREAYATARRDFPGAPVITCNRGLQIEPNPDFFFLSDQLACKLFAEGGKTASKRGKTKRITLRRDPQAMKMRTVDDFEIVYREGYPFEPFQTSGIWCVEYAIRVGGPPRGAVRHGRLPARLSRPGLLSRGVSLSRMTVCRRISRRPSSNRSQIESR